jgi:hypothetical protein
MHTAPRFSLHGSFSLPDLDTLQTTSHATENIGPHGQDMPLVYLFGLGSPEVRLGCTTLLSASHLLGLARPAPPRGPTPMDHNSLQIGQSALVHAAPDATRIRHTPHHATARAQAPVCPLWAPRAPGGRQLRIYHTGKSPTHAGNCRRAITATKTGAGVFHRGTSFTVSATDRRRALPCVRQAARWLAAPQAPRCTAIPSSESSAGGHWVGSPGPT